MKINYRKIGDYIPVDIDSLRPRGSYKNLIEKRTHSTDSLVKEFGKIPDDLLIKRNCPSCESKSFSKEMHKDHFTLVRCNNCDLVYTNPIFDDEHYKETYRSEDYQQIVKDLGEASHEYRLKRFGNERIKIMKEFLPSKDSIKYLDVGCSTGFVVEAAKNIGWEAIGIDLNPSAVSFGKSRGLDLRNSSLDEISFPENYFDAITLFDVLEHLSNPKDILEQSLKYLKKGGIIFIYVPNFDSASRVLLDLDAHFIWPTHHLNYYTPKTLTQLMKSLNLEISYLATEGLDLVDYMWHQEEIEHADVESLKKISDKLQFFINAGGYGKNLRIIASKK